LLARHGRRPNVVPREADWALAGRRLQLGGQALGMFGSTDLREQAVRLSELSLALLQVAALVRELGELNVDERLERLCPRVLGEFERARECGLDLRTGGGVG
jgi:hypothetical protein